MTDQHRRFINRCKEHYQDLGRYDASRGLCAAECPFPSGSFAGWQWLRGYLEAKGGVR